MDAVNDRFDDYTTTTDLQTTYATKAKVEEIDAKFGNYTTTTDLEANYMKKGDCAPTDSYFYESNGVPSYYVKNSDVEQIPVTMNRKEHTHN